MFFSAGEFIAITGCGGKTSLMFGLAEFFRRHSRTSITTTTTKIGFNRRGHGGALLFGNALALGDEIEDVLREHGTLTLARAEASGKLVGYSADEMDELWGVQYASYVIAECDGSRGMSFKAYQSYEPVIPSLATMHFVVVGAEIFFLPAGEGLVFRSELMRSRYPYSPDDILPRSLLYKLLQSPEEFLKGSPPSARRVLFVNKAELLSEEARASIACEARCHLKYYDELILASLRREEIFLHCGLERGTE